MLEQVVPNSNALFAVANQPPETTKAWAQLKKQVLKLNGSGKWLQSHPFNDQTVVWQTLAKKFSKATSAAVIAVASKKPDVISEAGDVVYQSCESCHQVFLSKTLKQ